MTFDDYQEAVPSTWNYSLTIKEQTTNALFGLTGEVGELTEIIKKSFFHGVMPDGSEVKEIGDILYYLTIFCHIRGWSLENIANSNLDKLKKRYPDKFTEHAAINRDLVAEREVLESE